MRDCVVSLSQLAGQHADGVGRTASLAEVGQALLKLPNCTVAGSDLCLTGRRMDAHVHAHACVPHERRPRGQSNRVPGADNMSPPKSRVLNPFLALGCPSFYSFRVPPDQNGMHPHGTHILGPFRAVLDTSNQGAQSKK